jgi:metal-responsive CopG/Arc/MetJ family transcriptional regulator
MATIQIIVDEPLLKAADREAKRQKMNRSALIRDALREHLKRLRQRDFEERDRRGYEAQPQRTEEYSPWEEIAAWPDE